MGNNGTHQSGNIFFAMFGMVAMVGVIGAAAVTVFKGPVSGMQRVTKHTVAENAMIAAGKLAVMASANQPDGGDCDGDSTVEPIAWSATGAGPFPIGGGYLPATLGAAQQDPWGNHYGYCAWDHGAKIDDPACGGASQKRAAGDPNGEADGIVFAIISSGPDRVFQTSCDDAPSYVVRASGSDDVVTTYTYGEAQAVAMATGGGLWQAKGDGVAEIARDIEIYSQAAPETQIFGVDSTDANRPAIKVDFITALSRPVVEFLSPLLTGEITSRDNARFTVTNGRTNPATVSMPQYGMSFPLSGGAAETWISGHQGVSLFTASAPRLRVDGSGNVGIGTDNPASKLDVRGIISGGFGANGTGGVLDWNDVSNTRSGSSPTLLLGNATNGPSGTASYFHAFNFEYGAKDGTGQITQLAIPYSNSTAQSQGIYMRGRYSGTWSPWKRVGDDLGNHTATQALNLGAHAINATVGTIRDANGGWVRTHGATGWYSQTYGGGWYMTDATYLRSYGTKTVLAPSYVDMNDPSYYLDPNATSRLNLLQIDQSSSYDVWIQGGTAGSGNARNLAVLGVKSTDQLYINHGSEYTGGTVIGGPVTIQGTLNATGGISGGTAYVAKAGDTMTGKLRINESGNDNLGSLAITNNSTNGNATGLRVTMGASTTGYAAYFISDSTTTFGGSGIMAWARNSGSFGGTGVSGRTDGLGENATGVYGFAAATSGKAKGVWGRSDSSNGYGVYCLAGGSWHTVGGFCGGNRGWSNTSDGRLKTNIVELSAESGLAALMRLRPVSYEWISQKSGKTEYGFIAQEVENVFPEMVGESPDTKIVNTNGDEEVITGVKSLTYSAFVVPLVKAVQELKASFDDLSAKVADLFMRTDAQEQRIARLETDNDNLRADNDNLRDEIEAIKAKLSASEGDDAACL